MARLDMARFSSKRIGDVDVRVSIEEVHHDELQITEHPVEQGAAITDHAFKRACEVVIKCGWSNADYKALLNRVPAVGDGSGMAGDTYVDRIYNMLLTLQNDRKPFDVITTRRKYSNMLLQSLVVTTNPKTPGALMVTATCREIFIVTALAAPWPPMEAQANPEATAATLDRGVQTAVPAVPAPGGAAPPETWR